MQYIMGSAHIHYHVTVCTLDALSKPRSQKGYCTCTHTYKEKPKMGREQVSVKGEKRRGRKVERMFVKLKKKKLCT